MPRSSKINSSPEGSLDNSGIRRRVGRACQRCRLKKCKCDGANPCTRCKSDDAICAYGKHQNSDKTVFRSGYVQMLERQHAQLTAGLQELYRRTQNGDGWTGPRLEVVNHNQPLTHKILEALGVLQADELENTKSVDGIWQGFERQGQDNCDRMSSETTSPSTQAAFSPISPTQTTFVQSTIKSKRRLKNRTSLAPNTQTLSMPPPLTTTFASVKPEPYNIITPSDNFSSTERMNVSLDGASETMLDWSFGMDDLFANLSGQEQTVKDC